MSAIQANMAGLVLHILVNEGDHVAAGQDVVMLESMKMEVPIQAEEPGTVQKIIVKEGSFVDEGQTLVELA